VLLLAAAWLPSPRREWWQPGLLAIFLVASLVKDVRYFRSPGEDWPGAARALLAATSHGACAVCAKPRAERDVPAFRTRLERPVLQCERRGPARS